MIAGLDLSLTAAAVIACPLDWSGDFPRVRSLVVGEPLRRASSDAERIARIEGIARRLLGFLRTHRVTEAWIEGYAFSQITAAHSLGELGGIVRLELIRAGIEVRTVAPNTARKLLLGKCPRSGAKVAFAEALRAAGAPRSWSLDESDAFAIANFALSEHGAFAFVGGSS